MGLDTNRYVGKAKLSTEFICSICRDIILRPKQINSSCEHIFCDECISFVVEEAQNLRCPNDRNPIEEPLFKKPSRYWLNTYSKLKLKCFYSSIGCKAIIEMEDLDRHENSCEYNPEAIITCKEGCDAEMARKVANNHRCIAYLKSLIDDLSLSRPQSQSPQYTGSIYDEIKSIKSQMIFMQNRLDATVERLNENLPKKSYTSPQTPVESEDRLLDLESDGSYTAPPVKPRRFDPSMLQSKKVILPKYTAKATFH